MDSMADCLRIVCISVLSSFLFSHSWQRSLNVGCVPSKAIIHSANMAHQLRNDVARMQEAGIFVDPSAVKVDFDKVMERVRKIRAEISHHDSATRYSKELGVDLFIGRGKFTSERTVVVNGRTLHFKRAVIATGAYPTMIPMEGLKELHDLATAWQPQERGTGEPRPAVITNETFFNLTQQPTHMVVIGAGVIGMELAQAMQRLGTPTTVLGRSGRVLPKEDEDMADIVRKQMIEDGVTFLLSVDRYERIELTGKVSSSGLPEMKITLNVSENGSVAGPPTEIICDAVLVAAGRRPNVTGIDLELAKVEYDTKLGLIVNDRLQTTNSRIYGVGDCAQQYKFTHAADFTARAVIRNAFFFGKEKLSDLLPLPQPKLRVSVFMDLTWKKRVSNSTSSRNISGTMIDPSVTVRRQASSVFESMRRRIPSLVRLLSVKAQRT